MREFLEREVGVPLLKVRSVMEGFKRALVVSIAARAWGALLGIVAVPLYIKFLGIEAYGLIGFFSSVQALVTFLDFGLGATLIRELARNREDDTGRHYARNITRTFEMAYILIAIVIGVVLVGVAPLLASAWMQLDTLDIPSASRALALGGVALALQWPSGLYGSGLAGLHKQVKLANISIIVGTLRIFFTLGVLWRISATIEAFFWAQIMGAFMQTLVMRIALWTSLECAGHRPSMDMKIFKHLKGFAGGMTGISITSILFTQLDKVVLSHALSMSDFGIYMLANALAMGLYMVISPMFSVLYPRFSSLVNSNDESALARQFHLAAQSMALLVIPLAVICAIFSAEILYVWTGDRDLSERGSLVLTLLVLGNGFNGIMNVPFALQLASGWISLSLYFNFIAITVMVPAAWYFSTYYGAVGGASVWFFLNASLPVIIPYFFHRKILIKEKYNWYFRDLLPVFIITSFIVLIALFFFDFSGSRLSIGVQLVLIETVTLFASLLFFGEIRRILFKTIKLN